MRIVEKYLVAILASQDNSDSLEHTSGIFDSLIDDSDKVTAAYIAITPYLGKPRLCESFCLGEVLGIPNDLVFAEANLDSVCDYLLSLTQKAKSAWENYKLCY